MPKYVIERDIPGAGNLSADELQAIAQASLKAANETGKEYHWVQTFVTGDKMYCVHVAPDEETIREHARRGGFPANRVSQVTAIFDAATADA